MMNPGGRESKRSEKRKKHLAGKSPGTSGSSFFAFPWSSGPCSAAAPRAVAATGAPKDSLIVVTALVLALMEEMGPAVTQAAAATPRDKVTAGRDWRGT